MSLGTLFENHCNRGIRLKPPRLMRCSHLNVKRFDYGVIFQPPQEIDCGEYS